MAEEIKSFYTQPLKVLVVEDNEIDRKVLESMLCEASNNITLLKSVATLVSAIKEIESDTYDVVILDLNLPDSSGPGTLVEINKKFPHIPIVVNTGAYEDSLGLKTLSQGAQDFLVKGKYTTYLLNRSLRFAIERKRLEREIIKTHDELREAQSQLIHAEKMKVIGALASGVAHEVKNPLAVVLYGITFLDHHLKEIDEQSRLVLDNIKEAVDRANLIVTDLLNFASLTKFNLKPENLNEIIEKSLSLVKHELEKNHIEVKKHFQYNLPLVSVDRNRIEQVLINLMLNALQAMNKGGKLLLTTNILNVCDDKEINQLAGSRLNQGDKVVVIDVEDTGTGISSESFSKIFEPFFTTKRGNGGIGLGLAVSKNIMQIYEGYIQMSNRPQGGAKATLVFKA